MGDLSFYGNTTEGKRKSKQHLALESRKRRGTMDPIEEEQLKDLMKKNKKRKLSPKKMKSVRKNMANRVSKVTAALKERKEEKEKEEEKERIKLRQKAKNTRASKERPGRSRIPQLPDDVREAMQKEWAEDISKREKE